MGTLRSSEGYAKVPGRTTGGGGSGAGPACEAPAIAAVPRRSAEKIDGAQGEYLLGADPFA